MRHILRKVLLALAGAAIFSTSAMADTTIVGAEDNSDSKYYAVDGHYARFTVEAGKTRTVQFTFSAATDEQVIAVDGTGNVWNPWYAWAVNFWDGTLNAITVEPREYGWEDKTDNNMWTAGWVTCHDQNYPTGWAEGTNFRTILDGATVLVTFKRLDADVIIIYDITTTDSKKYRQYFVKTYGDGTKTITFDLIVSHSHITIDNDKTTIADTQRNVTGTLLGLENDGGDFGTGTRTDFTIAPNSSLTLHFKNHTNKVFTWNSWAFEMQYGTDYADIVAGNLGNWGNLLTGSSLTFENINWPSEAEILEKMDGSDVVMTVERSDAKVTVTAVHTPLAGEPYTLKYTFTPTQEGFATGNVIIRLLTEASHIDLLPVSTTISSYGWSTFSSDYALDFSKADAGLEAYIITGRDGAVVTKSLVTGTVPAGTGLLLKGDASTAYNIPIVGSSDTDVSGNLLVAGAGAAVSYEAGKTKYVLGVNGSKAEFQKIVDGTPATVDRGKAYLQFNEVVTAPQLSFFGDVTGIEDAVKSDELRVKSYYNLAGQRIAQPTKGLYIVNGKKIVVK